MSFRSEIHNVIGAINAFVSDCNKTTDVPKEISESSQDSEVLLKSIERVTAEKTSILYRKSNIKEQLHLDISAVTKDLKTLRTCLRTWNRQEERSRLQRYAQRILFTLYTVPEINEIRSRLSLLIDVLSIIGHNETLKRHGDIREEEEAMEKVKASFQEFAKQRDSRLKMSKARLDEREKLYKKWESLGFGEKGSPEKVAVLKVFMEQKQQTLEKNCVGRADKQRHVEEITSRLWDPQTWDPPPRIRASRLRTTESRASSLSPPAHRPGAPRDDSRASSSSSRRFQTTPPSRESTSRMSRSHSSAGSRGSHHNRRDSSPVSNSATTSSERAFAGVHRSFHRSSTTSSRRASVSSSRVQSSVGTPRPRVNNDSSVTIPVLSLTDAEEPGEWTTVSAHGRKRTLQMTVSREMTGRIIGKGGKNIKSLEQQTRCSIRIFDEEIATDRKLVLAIGKAKDLEQVEERINAMLTLHNDVRFT